MPIYIFQNPKTEEIKEVFLSMSEDKIYKDKSGLEWKRLYTSPQLNTVGGIDAWNNADFVNKTANMKGTYGDMLDKSEELSQKRASENGGVDPVRQEYFKNYSKERGGSKHHLDRPKVYESKNVKIEHDK